jgi:hypothetical protein
MATQKRSGRGSSRTNRPMSRQEAGRRGPEYYQEIGQKGGRARWDEGEDEDYYNEEKDSNRRRQRGGRRE